MEVGQGHDGGLLKDAGIDLRKQRGARSSSMPEDDAPDSKGHGYWATEPAPREDPGAGWRRWCAQGPHKRTAERPSRLMADTKHLLIPWERVKAAPS